MKIVMLGLGPTAEFLPREELRKYGELLEYSEQDILRKGAAACIGDAEILLGGHHFMTNEIMDSCPNLRLMVIPATGYNLVDVVHARDRGITVCNGTGYGTVAVAQHAIALLLCLTNQVYYYAPKVREGEWNAPKKDVYSAAPLMELSGKTVGIIGYGRIGQMVGEMASGLGMRVRAFSGHAPAEDPDNGIYTDLDTLLRESDVISLNCPLNSRSLHMINRETIGKMKDGALLINTSRGALIDEEALTEALKSGKLRAAGLDVLEREPPAADNPLLKLPNCVITPHIAWAPPESRQRMAMTVAENVVAYLSGHPINVVN